MTRSRDAAEALARQNIRWIITAYQRMPESRQREFIGQIATYLDLIKLAVNLPPKRQLPPNLEDLI